MTAHDRLREAARALIRRALSDDGHGVMWCEVCRVDTQEGIAAHLAGCQVGELSAALAAADAEKKKARVESLLGIGDGNTIVRFTDGTEELVPSGDEAWTEDTLAEAIFSRVDNISTRQATLAARVALRKP